MIQLVWEKTMASSVTGKKINLPLVHAPANDRVGWIAKRRLDALLGRILPALHLGKAASANNPDGSRAFSHCARLNCKPAATASCQRLPLACAPASRRTPLSRRPDFT